MGRTSSERRRWDEAGLTRDGELDHVVAVPPAWRPTIAFTPAEHLELEGFIAVADASDYELLGTIKRFGYLLPLGNAHPLQLWRTLAADVRDTLSIAARLHAGDEPRLELPTAGQREVDELVRGFRSARLEPTIDVPGDPIGLRWYRLDNADPAIWPAELYDRGFVVSAASLLGNFVSALLQTGRVTYGLAWAPGERTPSSVLRTRPCVLANVALGLQAALAGAGGTSIRGIARCAACGLVYSPRRRPREDQASYCNEYVCKAEGRRRNDEERRRRARLGVATAIANDCG